MPPQDAPRAEPREDREKAIPRGVFRTVVSAEAPIPQASQRGRALPRATLGYAPEGLPVTAVPMQEPTLAAPARSEALQRALERPSSARPSTWRASVLPHEGEKGWVPAEGERFEELGTLGRGAMGEVALVLDHDLGRTVALKRQIPGAPVDRFIQEIRTLGKLEHPNIVPVHDVGREEDGRLFFVMKKIEGETLEHVIERLRARDLDYQTRFPFERRAEIVVGILHALAHAHASGVLHRDIKPENVMLGRHGEVQLVDWGVALAFDPDQRPTTREASGTLIGTPWFMSPEQARGENDVLDARSDLYAVAALFHEFLTLRHYLGELTDPLEVLAKVGREGWRWSLLDWHRPGPAAMPPMELYHFLRRGLAFERDARFSSADEMIGELNSIFEGRIRVQCPITLVKSSTRYAGRFVDRFPWTAFFGAATITALAGWGVVQLISELVAS